jgi:hypothetical protein
MTKDDILQALRLTAMGRAGHPLQEQLAEKLAAVFAQPIPGPVLPAPSVADAVGGLKTDPALLDAMTKRARKPKAD